MFCHRTHVLHHLHDPPILLLIIIFKSHPGGRKGEENKDWHSGCRKEAAVLKLILLNENFQPGSLISARFPLFPSCPISQACYHFEISGLCGYNGLPSKPAGWCKTCIFFLSLCGCLGRVEILCCRDDFYWSQLGCASLGCFITSGWLRNNAVHWKALCPVS